MFRSKKPETPRKQKAPGKRQKSLPRPMRRKLRNLMKMGKHAKVEAEYQREEALERAREAAEAFSASVFQATESVSKAAATAQERIDQANTTFQTRLDTTAQSARDIVQDLRAMDPRTLPKNVRKDERVVSVLNTIGTRMEELAGRIETLSNDVRAHGSDGTIGDVAQRAADMLDRSGQRIHSMAPAKEEREKSLLMRLVPVLVAGIVTGGVVVWLKRKR